jgi:DNA recombination protein RmuC
MIDINSIIIILGFLILGLILWLTKNKEKTNSFEQKIESEVKDLDQNLIKRHQDLSNQINEATFTFTNSIGNFKETFETYSKESIGETRKLNNLLKNNQQRGAWAERVLDDLLKHIGMLEGIEYEKQAIGLKDEDGEDVRPDFIFYLDGQSKVFPLDSKFPLSNFDKLYDENDNFLEENKTKYISDFKKRIVETSKYVNPSENTIELAAMFVPVSTILDKTIEIDSEIIDYALERKVVLVSPANFYALISFVKHSAILFSLSKEHEQVLDVFRNIQKQYDMYEKSFNQVDKKLSDLIDSIDDIKGTRTRMLSAQIKKIDQILKSSKKLND